MEHSLDNGAELGEYIIEKTLGVGGFGVTYLARDTRLGTKVAIKEYLPAAYAERSAEGIIAAKNNAQAQKLYQWGLQQFLKEAQALAQFKHNNIVRVLRFMEANGTAYMVMEYEPGQSLGERLASEDGTLDETTLLQIFIPILNGLQAMHEAGLVHLDIKPDNIYLCADNRPMLIDFGSASQIAQQNAAGQVALTPAYAAIEHYPDKGKRGPWTDIYSLGASMYRCISGKAPIGALERYKSILEYKKDPLPSVATMEISGYAQYLRDCIDWALEIYPQKRPHSAQMLQQGLMGKGRPGVKKPTEPVAAPEKNIEPTGTKQKFDKEGNKLTTDPWRIAKWGMSLLIVLVVGATAAVWLTRDTAPPETTLTVAEQMVPVAEPETSNAPVAASTVTADRILPPPTKLKERVGGHENWVIAVNASLGNNRIASADTNGVILLWQNGSALPIEKVNAHRKSIQALALSPDGKTLASAGAEGNIKLWDSQSLAPRGELPGHSYAVFALSFSPDGRWLASAGKDRIVVVWDLATMKSALELAGHEAAVNALGFSPDGQILVSAGENIRLWSMATGQPLGELFAHKGKVFTVDFSRDGHWLASAGAGGVIKLWDMKSENSYNLNGAPESVLRLKFSPDGHWLASAGIDHRIQLWSVDNTNFYEQLSGHTDAVETLTFNPDGSELISGGRDRKLLFWKRN